MFRIPRLHLRAEIGGISDVIRRGADWSLLEFAKKVAAIPKNVAKDLDRESSKPISETITVLTAPEQVTSSNSGSSETPLRPSKELAVESDNLQIANNY